MGVIGSIGCIGRWFHEREGVVGLNDCGWRPVDNVLQFLAAYRRYRERNLDLPNAYRGRNPLFLLIRKVEDRSSLYRCFAKIEQWEPEHGFRRQL